MRFESDDEIIASFKKLAPQVKDMAFPVVIDGPNIVVNGLSKREYFSGLILQGMVPDLASGKCGTKYVVKTSVQIADALIAELDSPAAATELSGMGGAGGVGGGAGGGSSGLPDGMIVR